MASGDPVSLALIVGLVQLIVVAGGAVWAVAQIKSRTTELAHSIKTLSRAIDKLDNAVERLDVAIRDLDRRVTRLEVMKPDAKAP